MANYNEDAFAGLSRDEIAVYRFIQGMSVERKEALAREFILGMSEQTKAEFEREILDNSDTSSSPSSSPQKSPPSSPSKSGIFAAASKLFAKGKILPRNILPSSKTPKAA